MNRIFWIIAVVVVVVLAVAYYSHESSRRATGPGAVAAHEPAGGGAGAQPAIQTAQTNQPTQTEQPGAADQSGAQARDQTTGVPTPPAKDSISRNPPNGMIFAGSGKYQLYRQGDITWRLNTDSGEACVLFATDAEWAKPRVYQHGCGAN